MGPLLLVGADFLVPATAAGLNQKNCLEKGRTKKKKEITLKSTVRHSPVYVRV